MTRCFDMREDEGVKEFFAFHDSVTEDAIRVAEDGGRLVLELHTPDGCAGLVLVDGDAQRRLAEALHREFGPERIAAVH